MFVRLAGLHWCHVYIIWRWLHQVKIMPFSISGGSTVFFDNVLSQGRVDPNTCTPFLCRDKPKTFRSSWILLKISKTDSWLSPTPPNVGTLAPDPRSSALAHFILAGESKLSICHSDGCPRDRQCERPVGHRTQETDGICSPFIIAWCVFLVIFATIALSFLGYISKNFFVAFWGIPYVFWDPNALQPLPPTPRQSD